MPDLKQRLDTALAGRYTVEREVGRGGMATVYLAQDQKHRRRVAVKILHPHIAAHVGTDRFLREIEIAARQGRCRGVASDRASAGTREKLKSLLQRIPPGERSVQ